MAKIENSRKIRVLHVVQKMESAGIQSFIMNVYRKIDKEKIQFDFLVHYTEKGFYDKEIEKMGGNIFYFPFREDKRIIRHLINVDNFFKANANKYDAIHVHMDSIGFIYMHYAKKYGIRIRIAHAHTVIRSLMPKKILRRILNKYFKKNATELVACSTAAGKYMFGNNEFKVINNPVDIDLFKYDLVKRSFLRKKLHLEDKIVIGHVGRFSKEKNHTFLIRIFNELKKINKKYCLTLLGTGPDEQKVKRMVSKYELENDVLFLGNRNNIYDYYQVMDCFIFPSVYEGLGLAAIEAQISGLPTFCSNVLPPELAASKSYFAFSTKDDIRKTSTMIDKVLSNYERFDQSTILKEKGFDIEEIKEQILKLYKQ